MSNGTAPTKLTYVFDRPASPTKHPWGAALPAIAADADVGRRAVAENWSMDHRVGSAREAAMLGSGHFHGRPDAEDWWVQRLRYFSGVLCLPADGSSGLPRAAYVEDHNAANLILPTKLPRHNVLLHVASLNRLLWRLSSAEYATADLKLGFLDLTGHLLPEKPPGGWDDTAFNAMTDAIAAELGRRGPEAVRDLAGLLSESLGPTEPPWWAAFAMELHSILKSGDWYSLCLALGLGHLDEGEWVLAWRYPVAKAGLIYRPTSVEANDSPYHFPSPPGSLYGVTMPLDDRMAACREVIHAPLKGDPAREACTGDLGRIAGSPAIAHNRLTELRKVHCQRLERAHPQVRDRDWLRRHPLSP